MKAPLTALVATVSVGILSTLGVDGQAQVVTQTNYTTQNFNTNSGYVRGVGITATNQPLSLRWQGNDPYNSGTDRGLTDFVGIASGYTPFPGTGNSSLLQGGYDVFYPIIPGTNDVRIWDSFAPSSTIYQTPPTVSFFAEWSIIGSSPLNAPYTNSDTFSFDLRNAANTASLLSLQFTPGINIQSNSYTLQTLATGEPTGTLIDLGYGSLFQVQVDMTGTSYALSLARLNPTTRAVITNYNNLATGNLSSGYSALDFGTISLDWELASGNSELPGSNYIIANQFQVTTTGTPIPEAGTWAASLLLLGIGAGYYRRRRAQHLTVQGL